MCGTRIASFGAYIENQLVRRSDITGISPGFGENGVFDARQNMEEWCLPFLFQICQGDIKELYRKGWTWDPDLRQLRLPCPCPKTSFSAWTDLMKRGAITEAIDIQSHKGSGWKQPLVCS